MRTFGRLLSRVAVALAVLGVASADAQQLFFYPVTPCRSVDTRSGSPLQSGVSQNFPLRGVCGVPAQAGAVALNATVVGPTGDGDLILSDSEGTVPSVATILFRSSVFATANNAIVPLADSNSQLATLATVAGSGTVHLIVDVTGYFLPGS